jgi:hypothetical protein
MKLTKKQLKQIIKEEILKEKFGVKPTPNWDLEEKLDTAALVIEQELEGLLAGTEFEGELTRLKLRLQGEVAGMQRLK